MHTLNMKTISFLLLAICVLLPSAQGACSALCDHKGCSENCKCGEPGGQCNSVDGNPSNQATQYPPAPAPSADVNPKEACYPPGPHEQLINSDPQHCAYGCEPGYGYDTIDAGKCVPKPIAPSAASKCPSRPSEHLIPDSQYYPQCVYKCEDGYQFNDNHDCVKMYNNPQVQVAGNQPLVDENGNKITTLTLNPNGKITLGAKCLKFIALVKASMGTEKDVDVGLMNIAEALASRQMSLISEKKPEPIRQFIAYTTALVSVYLCYANCEKLFDASGMLSVQSASSSPLLLGSLRKTSVSPVQIGLRLESGPFLAEVVNNGVSLSIDTATATVSSIGNNTFGVVCDPTNSTSYIVAYEQPVNIQPKNNSIVSFTLNGNQAVIVGANYVSPVISLASIPMGGQVTTSGTQTNSGPQISKGVPNSGLIAYYSFDDGTARDNSGNGNDGQLQGGASIVPGKIGAAVSLDGLSSSVNIRKTSAFNPGDQMTVSFWMKADPKNAMDKCCQGLVTTDNYGIEISGGKDPRIGVNFFTNTGGSYYHTSDAIGGGSPVSSGQWHHVAGVYDGSSMKLYIDGSLVANRPQSGSISPMLSTSFLAIGSEDGRTYAPNIIGARYFSGLIDEVAIYNRALSAGEVATL